MLSNQQKFIFDEYNMTSAIKKYSKVDWLPISYKNRGTVNYEFERDALTLQDSLLNFGQSVDLNIITTNQKGQLIMTDLDASTKIQVIQFV